MTTLIAVYTSEGCVGRCDARCYDAKHPGCDCICGGRNHGAGIDRATENTREMAEEWLDDYYKDKEIDPKTATAKLSETTNPTLFDVASFSNQITSKKRRRGFPSSAQPSCQ